MKISYFYSLKFLIRGLLGYVAYVVIMPSWLCPLLHKLRGVRIKNVFNVYIAANVVIDSIYPEYVEIDEDVFITRGVKLIAHFIPTQTIRSIIKKDITFGKIVIKKGAFIGANAIVLPNVTIGEGSLIQAGSVITKNVPDYAIVEGNPGKVTGFLKRA